MGFFLTLYLLFCKPFYTGFSTKPTAIVRFVPWAVAATWDGCEAGCAAAEKTTAAAGRTAPPAPLPFSTKPTAIVRFVPWAVAATWDGCEAGCAAAEKTTAAAGRTAPPAPLPSLADGG